MHHAFRLFRYSLVGAANTLLYAALLFLFLDVARIGSTFSVTASYLIAMTFQFFANRSFTFRNKNVLSQQFTRYLIVAGVSYLISLALVWLLLDFLLLPTIVVIAACGFTTAALGYVAGFFWVYK